MGVYSKIKRLLTVRTNQAVTSILVEYPVGTPVDFIDSANNIQTGVVRAYVGGASYLQYYIQVGKEPKTHLVIAPKIWLSQRNVADRKPSKTSKNAKESL